MLSHNERRHIENRAHKDGTGAAALGLMLGMVCWAIYRGNLALDSILQLPMFALIGAGVGYGIAYFSEFMKAADEIDQEKKRRGVESLVSAEDITPTFDRPTTARSAGNRKDFHRADTPSRSTNRPIRKTEAIINEDPEKQKWAIAIIGGLLAVVLIGAFDKRGVISKPPAPATGVVGRSSALRQTSSLLLNRLFEQMPSDEQAFIAAVQRGQIQYRNGGTDLQKGSARPVRAYELCGVLPSDLRVSGWIGMIRNLTTNNEGRGVIEIQIADNISISTWNNVLSDIRGGTLVNSTSVLYAKTLQMQMNQTVYFTGEFFKSKLDCVTETSLTIGGSLAKPRFIMRFEDISSR